MSTLNVGTIQNLTNLTASGQVSVGGNLLMNSGYGSAATAYGCRAWVNFNGTGTVAIRASGNVSSITDNGTGSYTVNFTTAMPDANFAVLVTHNQELQYAQSTATQTYATGSIRFSTFEYNNANVDPDFVNVAIFR